MRNIIRAFWFVIFFSVGAGALSVSILCSDLVRYYHNKQLLKAVEEHLNDIKSLNEDYDVLQHQLETDPNTIRRIAPVTLGTAPVDDDSISPKLTPQQLDTARRALKESMSPKTDKPAMPDWLIRCSEPRRMFVLFLAGALLILISF